MRPFVYAVADDYYNRTYAASFLNSARAAGHQAEVFVGDMPCGGSKEKAQYAAWRYRMLPEMLAKHPAVLIVDIDSIFNRAMEVDDKYDLGLFIRNWKHEPNTRVLGGLFYCTSRGLGFAEAMAQAMSAPRQDWGDDQAALWHTYEGEGHKYQIKMFNNEDIDWEIKSDPIIFTAKGLTKDHNTFKDMVFRWGHKGKAA